MSNSSEHMQVEFHSKASEALFGMLRAFENATSKVNRQKDERLYQELKKKHALTLERELQNIGSAILAKHHRDIHLAGTDQVFFQLIKDYMHRFNQKVAGL